VRALDFERRGDDVREELPREEALPEEPLREEAPRDDRDPVELLRVAMLPPADLDAPLLLEVLLLLELLALLELPVEPLFDLVLPDRALAEDDRAPDEREELLLRDLPLDFDGMVSPFFLLHGAMKTPALQDANSGGNSVLNILQVLCVATCAVWLDRRSDSTLKCRQALWAQSPLSGT
jgi:hypothetical protein